MLIRRPTPGDVQAAEITDPAQYHAYRRRRFLALLPPDQRAQHAQPVAFAQQRIRALGGERFTGLPIIAMTALAMAHDEQRSLAAGMNDHITKPISPEHLQAALAKWLKIPIAPTDGRLNIPSVLEDDLRRLTHLDAEQGVRRIGGDSEAYRKQLRRFRTRYADAADKLADLIASGTTRQAEEYCHALKGVCGNIGADALFACLSDIDNLLKKEIRPGGDDLDRLRGLLGEVAADIDSLAAEPGLAPVSGGLLGREDVVDKIGQLLTLLESDLGAAQAVLAALRAGISGTDAEAVIREVAERIDLFEIDEALGLLRTLQAQLVGQT